MADLFSMKSPLMIRFADGEARVMAEYFAHPEGLLYFDLFWMQAVDTSIHLVKGEYKGEGPWKIGNAVISVLACHGSNADLATQFSEWQSWMQMFGDEYPAQAEIEEIARAHGASVL